MNTIIHYMNAILHHKSINSHSRLSDYLTFFLAAYLAWLNENKGKVQLYKQRLTIQQAFENSGLLCNFVHRTSSNISAIAQIGKLGTNDRHCSPQGLLGVFSPLVDCDKRK